MIQVFLQSILIGYSGSMMPGSLLTYTIDRSIKSGAKSGLLISIGHSLLEFFIVILILAGVGKYLGTVTAQIVIGFLGGLVLNFLGISMIKDAYLNKISINLDSGSTKGGGSMIIGGAVISASNPYFLFWWAAVGLGLILSAYKAFGILGVTVFYFGHILSDISWYCFVSLLFSRTRKFINLSIYRVIIAILGICLTDFGISFIVNSIRHLAG